MLRYVAVDDEDEDEGDVDDQPAVDVTLQRPEQGAGDLYRSDPARERVEGHAQAAARAEEAGTGHWGACT